jgi:hypothetical protein
MPIDPNNPNYVKSPTAAEVARRLKPLGLTPEDVKLPPLVVNAGQRFDFSSCTAASNVWRRPLPKPRDLEHLKEMIGVPNHVFAVGSKQTERIFEVDEKEVLSEGLHLFYRRTPKPSAAYKMAVNLVYRYADPNLLSRSPYQELVQLMLAAAGQMSMVVGSDLIVDNGATVDLGPDPVVSFERIIIHGTGQIIVHDHQKVAANSIQYLTA